MEQQNEKVEGQNTAPKIEKVQGPTSETIDTALKMMREFRKKYDEMYKANDSKQLSDMNLYEFPKVMAAIRAAEVENVGRRERGEPEFIFELASEFKAMLGKPDTYDQTRKSREEGTKGTLVVTGTDKYGITEAHIQRQRELALGDYQKAKQKE